MKLLCIFLLVCLVGYTYPRYARKIRNKPALLGRNPYSKHQQPLVHPTRLPKSESRYYGNAKGRNHGVGHKGGPRQRQPITGAPQEIQRGPRLNINLQDNRWSPIGLQLRGNRPVKSHHSKTTSSKRKPGKSYKKPIYPKKKPSVYPKQKSDFYGKSHLQTGIRKIDVVQTGPTSGGPIRSTALQQQNPQQQSFSSQQQSQFPAQQQSKFPTQQRPQFPSQQRPQYWNQQQSSPPQFSAQQQQTTTQQPSTPDLPSTGLGNYEELNGLKIYKFNGVEGRGTYNAQQIYRLNSEAETVPDLPISWGQAPVFGEDRNQPFPILRKEATLTPTHFNPHNLGPSSRPPPFPTVHTSPRPNGRAVVIIATSNVSQN